MSTGNPQQEVELTGGTANRGQVVRVGDTVRRPQPANADGIHALLEHLTAVGFGGAPRFLGVDEQGREVLSYVPGDAAKAPHPPWALTLSALQSVARLLRRYHEAAASFDPSPYSWRSVVPERFRTEGFVGHNDPNLDNVVFRDGEAVALLDFDLASPGSPIWDVGLAARLWVPLRSPADFDDDREGDVHARLRVFTDAYGVDDDDLRRVVPAAVESHNWCYGIVDDGARRGQPGYVAYWTTGARERDQRGRRWLRENAGNLDSALRAKSEPSDYATAAWRSMPQPR